MVWYSLVCIGMVWYSLVCIDMYVYVFASIVMDWYELVLHIGIHKCSRLARK